MYKKILNLCIALCVSNFIFSQFNTPNPSTPSATIATSMQSIKINNDLYNGRVNVSLPVLNYEFEGLQFPIVLDYSGGNGLRTDEIPGWVGLGWNLISGGYIHRTVRGKPDEVLDFETQEDNTVITGIGSIRQKKTILNKTDFSYLSNFNKLTGADWYSLANANSLRPSQSNYSYTLSIPPSSICTYYNHHPTYDLAPDEFTFSIGNVSGKFYFNHLGKWVLNASDGMHYTVEAYAGEQYINKSQKVPKIIKYITLLSENGVKYYFGNDDLNAPFGSQYFDYSHSSSNLPTNLWEATITPGATLVDIVPHTWHLTKIENLKTHSIITLNYKLTGLQFHKSRQCWGNEGGIVYNNDNKFYSGDPTNIYGYINLSAISKVASRSWTLTAINFPNNVKIQFESSVSTQLSSDESLNYSENAGFYQYEDMFSATGNNTLLKLDKVVLKNGDEVKREINFEYVSSAAERMKLKTMTKSNEFASNSEVYTFGCNNSKLPGYAAGRNDHWGFFNNKDFFESTPPPYKDFSKLSNYTSFREPDPLYMQAEILTSIHYPTGGEVVFEYEPHKYAKRVNEDFTITNTSNTIGGGVRIHKVIYKPDKNGMGEETLYDYRIPGGETSSGILNSVPKDYLVGTSSSFSFRASGFNPIFYSGSPVTYTYAKEIKNGSIQYEYTNYDNGYNNELPIEKNTTSNTAFDYAYKNNSFKRGKLKSLKISDDGGNKLRESEYKYEHDVVDVVKDEIRSLYYKEQGTLNYYYTSVMDEIYQDHVIEEIERNYSPSGSIEQKKNTVYDLYGNIKETKAFTNSGQVIRKKNKYCYEYQATGNDNISLGIKYLNDHGFRNSIVESITYRENINGSNSVIINAELYSYKNQAPFIDKRFALQVSSPLSTVVFTESKISGNSFIMDTRYSCEIQFNEYDSKGNVLEQTSKNNVKEAYLWGYNSQYCVAKIIGSDYSTVSSKVNPGTIQSLTGDALTNALAPLRTLAHTFVSTYTYSPLVGLTSNTDFAGKTIFYEYNNFDKLYLVRDHDKKIIKQFCYNYFGQPEECRKTYKNSEREQVFVSNSCKTSFSGLPITYKVAAGKYISLVSQADADQKAISDIAANGQSFANQYGQCCNVFVSTSANSSSPGPFTIVIRDASNNTVVASFEDKGYSGFGSACKDLPAGKNYVVEASSMDPLYVSVNGVEKNTTSAIQSWTTSVPIKIELSTSIKPVYYNTSISRTFTKNNCTSDKQGTQVTYTIPAGTYSSTISVEDANSIALAQATLNGQNYANQNGTCVPKGTNLIIDRSPGSAITSWDYLFTIKDASTGNIVKDFRRIDIPYYGSLPDGSYSIEFGGPLRMTISVNGNEKSINNSTANWNWVGTPITIYLKNY